MMISPCDKCEKQSVIFIRYSGQHLCGEHFLDLVRRRVKKELRYQKVFKKGRRIGIAVSGGKDSILLLKLVHEVGKLLNGTEMVILTVDEGIAGYRPSSLKIVESLAGQLELEWKLYSFDDDLGKTMDDLAGWKGMGPCSICGIFRRRALNKLARESGCGILLTGHNLDDMAQTILMNVLQADVQRLARLGPHLNPMKGFIPRGMPLRTIPETETYLSATLLGLPIHESECPYSEEAKRGHYRDLLMKAEAETPGTRHSLLRFNEQVAPHIPRECVEMISCSICGEPSIINEGIAVCRSCSLLNVLKAELEIE
jgi:uncharacterized protein (TIGR00269 family)